MKLKYPKGFLLNIKKKVVCIRKKSKSEKKRKTDMRFNSIPNSKAAVTIANRLETAGVNVAITTGKRVGEILTRRETSNDAISSVAYKVPCGTCDKSYINETGRGIEKRLKEHNRDLRNDMDHSAFVVHAHKTHHLPHWDRAMILASCKSKGHRKATEAAFIATNETINTRVGFIKLAKPAALFGVRYISESKTWVIVLFITLYLIILLYTLFYISY